MFKGVHHVGVGVSNMDRSLEFYRDLGFTQAMFDYTGFLPGMEGVTGKSKKEARVVMLKNQNTGPLGLGMIKLVHLLPPDKSEPCIVHYGHGEAPAGSMRWGDLGITELCFNTRVSTSKIYEQLADKGVKAVLTPTPGNFPPYDTKNTFAYFRDPDNGLLEFIEWEMGKSLGTEARVEGVNHVAFGVSDMDRSLEFYRELGFTDMVFDPRLSTKPRNTPPRAAVTMMANFYGAWIEPIQLLAAEPTPFNKGWGHLGPMEFAIEVTNIEKAYEELQERGIKFLCPPQTVEVSSGDWKYAYVVEPNNLYVSLIEPRY